MTRKIFKVGASLFGLFATTLSGLQSHAEGKETNKSETILLMTDSAGELLELLDYTQTPYELQLLDSGETVLKINSDDIFDKSIRRKFEQASFRSTVCQC